MKRTLEQWLTWQESLHPATIELGLDRVRRVAESLVCLQPTWPVVSVAGTNGKGSSCAMLESIYRAAGYRTATYTSPHLWRYNERVRLGGEEVTDAALCRAFERVEAARGDTSLTYFEFGTLAALDLIERYRPDVALLEIGLGGRLDAVNIVDPTVALITHVGLDHQDWLGEDRETIGFEKAGIMRAGRPAVVGDPDPPASLCAHADGIGASLYCAGREFEGCVHAAGWRFRRPGSGGAAIELPRPGLAGPHQYRNAAAVAMVVELLQPHLRVPQLALADGVAGTRLAARMQHLDASVPVIADVAHNADGSRALAAALAAEPVSGATHAVVGILADKAVDEVLQPLLAVVGHWYCSDLPTSPRGLPAAVLKSALERGLAMAGAATPPPSCYPEPAAALAAALSQARPGDRVLVFGSFVTVAAATPDPARRRTLSDPDTDDHG